ncbi:MAG: hypothetical protein LQ348_000244 [Seirophora lacunosa]|nr:MAG: hypothetical protein LQ348_000244 [Seirophora lacunosa]
MRKYAINEHLAHLICSTSSVTLPFFLAPSLLFRSSGSRRNSRLSTHQHASVRLVATASARAHIRHYRAVGTAKKEIRARRAMSKILGSLGQPNKQAWINLLEPFLPPNLRRKASPEDDLLADAIAANEPVPMQDLHIWLAEARKMREPKGDLLTYLVVEEARHDAVLWLVEEMLKESIEQPEIGRSENAHLSNNKDYHWYSLDDLTWSSDKTQAMIDATGFAGFSLDPMTQGTTHKSEHACLKEVWRSIGAMVLHAANHEPASAESKSTMTCVHRLLAYLHHVGAIPSTIYNHTPAKDPSVLQRPPTIYLWSYRILAIISDAWWTSAHTGAQRDGNVHSHSPGSGTSDETSLSLLNMSSIMSEVPPQIWLDYVLWCCVEGGWITEAAEIVYDMWTSRGERQQYSVIDYNSLREQHAPKLPWVARIKASIRKSRMRETPGGAIFGSFSDREGYLKPPERTVSSEVVAAIIDGLVNTASPRPDIYGNKWAVVERYVSVCKIMLDRKRLGLGSNSWYSIVLRVFDSLSNDPKVPPTFVETIVSWSPTLLHEPFAANSAYHSDSKAPTYVTDPSAVSLGLLSCLLLELSLAGDLRGALRVFRRLQSIIDANRETSIASFQAMVTSILQQDGDDTPFESGEQQEPPGLNMRISSHILGPFLDLITDAKEFDLANWLLHNDDVDGCIIPPSMYSDAVLQPSLIHFASAAGDKKLLDSVTQRLEPPVPERVLHSLLHHQIQCAQWDAVHEILELLRDGQGLAWDPTDVIALASAILRSERNPPAVSLQEGAHFSPWTPFKSLLHGRYNTRHDPSRPRNLDQMIMLKQLARMLASIPSRLANYLLPFCNAEYQRLTAKCTVPTTAFNMLLETVVDVHGAPEGRRLCENWCVLPGSASNEQVVQPNMRTFYTILRPLEHAEQFSRATGDNEQARAGPHTHPQEDMVAPPFTIDGPDSRLGEASEPSSLDADIKAEHVDSTVPADLIGLETCDAGAGTPPISIRIPPELRKCERQSPHKTMRGQAEGLDFQQLLDKHFARGSTHRRKKRNLKKAHNETLYAVHGFTPATSEDERSDLSVDESRSRNEFTASKLGSLARRAGFRSSSPGPGVSALTQQLEDLQRASKPGHRQRQPTASSLRIKTEINNLPSTLSTSASPSPIPSPTASQSSATSESMKDGESNKTVSYQVALKDDFVSPDIAQRHRLQYADNATMDHVVRKMAASDFDPLRCLGKGTYGTVHLVKQVGTGRLFAQKQFRKASLTVKQQLVEQTKTERAILESINRHPYVVKLFYAFQDHEKLYLILEYAQGGELFTRMLTEGMFPEETAAFYMAEMILALNHLHDTVGVVYRDLKPENCLLDADGHLLLTDFGLSKVAVDGDYRCRSMTGTLEYMAPEVIQQQSYGPEVDWWSFGVLGFELLVGNSPFHANNDAKIQEKIVKCKLVLPFFMSADAKDLLTRLLRKRPKERLGARMPKDLQLIKGHRFFRKIDWKKLEKRQVEPPFKPVITDPELAENFSSEFTELAVSPVMAHPKRDWGLEKAGDQFGGFSFVASRSLLTSHDGFF